jgi:hypothetical protein
VTPDGKTAAYAGSGGLYKRSDGHTELGGIGPKGVSGTAGCLGDHYVATVPIHGCRGKKHGKRRKRCDD